MILFHCSNNRQFVKAKNYPQQVHLDDYETVILEPGAVLTNFEI